MHPFAIPLFAAGVGVVVAWMATLIKWRADTDERTRLIRQIRNGIERYIREQGLADQPAPAESDRLARIGQGMASPGSPAFTLGGIETISTLSRQCAEIGWPLRTEAVDPESVDLEAGDRPEQIVLERYVLGGYQGCWCEGRSFKLLMKAACLPFLIANSPRASDPSSTWLMTPDRVIGVFFEAHCRRLMGQREQLVATIRRASTRKVKSAIREICTHPSTREYFPRVAEDFLVALWNATGPKFIARMADRFTRSPYEYRSGWPDLTLIGRDGVRFVEVKVNDHLLLSQLRFARDIANPLGLRCEVVRVIPAGCGQVDWPVDDEDATEDDGRPPDDIGGPDDVDEVV